MRYIYSVLRFVPDTARGEFINIGAIVGSEESAEWSLRLIGNPERARRMDESGVLRAVWSYASDIGGSLDAFNDAVAAGAQPPEMISERWLSDLWERSENMVQLSRPAPVSAPNLAEAFELVFGQFIIDPESRKYPFKKRPEATAAVRQAYRSYQLRKGVDFVESPLVKGGHHREEFDFAVANGSVVQLAQTWSLQLPNTKRLLEDIKAWAFTVQDIRENGGTALTKSRQIDVPRGVAVFAVYIPPATDGAAVLEEAMSAFARIDASPIPFDHANTVGQLAYDSLTRTGWKPSA